MQVTPFYDVTILTARTSCDQNAAAILVTAKKSYLNTQTVRAIHALKMKQFQVSTD